VTEPPRRPLDVYAASVALDLIDARAHAAALVKRAGASVIEAPPDEFASACVRGYLTAKARLRL
jgi:uncharacterized protein (DUF58 family)